MKRTEIKRRPLADTVLATLEPDDKEYRELDGSGLYFRVKPDGKKSWQLRYKTPAGKWSWLGLGTYPAVGGSMARKKATLNIPRCILYKSWITGPFAQASKSSSNKASSSQTRLQA